MMLTDICKERDYNDVVVDDDDLYAFCRCMNNFWIS